MWLVSSEELWLREIVQMAPSLYDKSGAWVGTQYPINPCTGHIYRHISLIFGKKAHWYFDYIKKEQWQQTVATAYRQNG